MTEAIEFTRRPINEQAQISRFGHTSPSGFTTLEQCPRKYAIQRDFEKAHATHPDMSTDTPTYKMVFGTVFHQAVEDGDDADVDAIAADKCAVLDEDAWDDYYKGHEAVALGVRNCLSEFYKSEYATPWLERDDDTLIEESFDATIDGMEIRGKVDLITPEGHVTDLKTTNKSFPQWHGSQLCAYWMLAEANGVDVKPEASVIKIYRPRKPDGISGVEELQLDAELQKPHVLRLLGHARWMRDNEVKWQDDYTQIRNNPGCSHCRFCVARGTSACPETRTW